jgi:hypothetical protein
VTSRAPTRLQQALACRRAGLALHFAGAGFELASARLGVTLVPTASATLRLGVTGYPALTGLAEPCELLEAPVSAEFALADITLDGDKLSALAPDPLAPVLRQGFVLALDAGMADVVRAWLPRLGHVALQAQALATSVEATLDPEARAKMGEQAGAQAHGLALCTEIVAEVVLDAQSPAAALAAAQREHWADAAEAWLLALATPEVQEQLAAARGDAAALPLEPLS